MQRFSVFVPSASSKQETKCIILTMTENPEALPRWVFNLCDADLGPDGAGDCQSCHATHLLTKKVYILNFRQVQLCPECTALLETTRAVPGASTGELRPFGDYALAASNRVPRSRSAQLEFTVRKRDTLATVDWRAQEQPIVRCRLPADLDASQIRVIMTLEDMEGQVSSWLFDCIPE